MTKAFLAALALPACTGPGALFSSSPRFTAAQLQGWRAVTKAEILRVLELDAMIHGGEITDKLQFFKDGGSFGLMLRVPGDAVLFVTAIHSSIRYNKAGTPLRYAQVVCSTFGGLDPVLSVSDDQKLRSSLLQFLRRHQHEVTDPEITGRLKLIMASLEG